MSADNLVWIDLEMTGLDVDHDHIIEIATVVTTPELDIIADGPVIALHQPQSRLAQMDQWNTKQHTQSGLIDRVLQSRMTASAAERDTLDFLAQYVPAGQSPMCGNSICQDRRFLHKEMPHLERYFHYRNLDVSTLKILMQRWKPDIAAKFTKTSQHLALADIYDSIEELAFYRQHLFNT